MKKIIYLVINSLYGGGAEHVAARLTKEWAKKYGVIIFSLNGESGNDYEFCGEVVSLKQSYKGLTVLDKTKRCAKLIDERAAVDSPIAIIGFLQNANLCVTQTKYSAIKILSIRNYLDRQYSGYKLFVWKILIKLYFKKADKIVSVSKGINDDMMNKYGLRTDRCFCIYNPYNGREIKSLSCEEIEEKHKLFFEEHTVLSNVGHLSKQKGQYQLLRILPELKKEYPDIGLVIVGDDSSKFGDQLKQMVREMGIEKNVLFTGRQKNPYKFVCRSKIFVFPSLYEGFPNALVEAMYCNIPVIATDCKTGPREILISNNGETYGILISDNRDVWKNSTEPLCKTEQQLILEIKKLLDDDITYKQYKAYAEKRANDFSYEKIMPQWQHLLDDEDGE